MHVMTETIVQLIHVMLLKDALILLFQDLNANAKDHNVTVTVNQHLNVLLQLSLLSLMELANVMLNQLIVMITLTAHMIVAMNQLVLAQMFSILPKIVPLHAQAMYNVSCMHTKTILLISAKQQFVT